MRTLAIAVACLLAAASTRAGNLLVNGELTPGGGGWVPVQPSDAACATLHWDEAGVLEVAFDCGAAAADAGWQQSAPVVGGAWYRIEARAAAAALSGEGDVELTFRDAAGKVIWKTGTESFAGTFEWDGLAWRVRAPEGSARLDVWLGVRHGVSGTAYFDTARLEELPGGGWRDLSVDLDRTVGTLRRLAQTNRGPRLMSRSGVIVDYSARLAAAGVTMIRGHDVHTAFDTSVVFPDPGADPADPGAYRFGSTDVAIAEAAAGGFEVLFRLGESFGGPKTPRMSAEKWAEVAHHIVLHVNQGWAGGTRAGVRYWEIWNEPNGPLFWSGTPEAFYDLYARAAAAVRSADPSARVGGPGLAGHTHEGWVRGLLRHIAATGAPLDFFSWHVYHMGNPHTLARAQRQLRRLLDEEGFAATELINTEWNIAGGPCEATGCRLVVESAYNAAHAAGALAHLQDTDIGMAFRYRTDGTGLFGMCGDGVSEPEWSRSGLAFRLWAELFGTPVRLATMGGDTEGFAVIAGRSADGASVRVLVANQGSPEAGYRLRLAGAPARFRWEVAEVSDRHPCAVGDCTLRTVASGTEAQAPDGVLDVPLAAPGVHLVRIQLDGEPARVPRRRLPARR
ncbi:MAG TPA: hypothetical protein P5234_04765 [Thermoanaerobaculaceae bacterium]|nr:hypothetical protein [Thermoanaerobaculaceae bacterium]HRS15544.1 hypothetical protein [Thermoanaerobaculaceae bacterium]